MAYHPLGESKLARLGKAPGPGGEFAAREQLEPFRRRLAGQCAAEVGFA